MTSGNFTEDELREALLYIQDILERCQIPFVVIGNVANQMYRGLPLDDYKIVIALKEQHCVPECVSTLKTIAENIETTTSGWRIMYNSVPINLNILDKKYHVFDDPDTVFYAVEAFNIPNPFETYWAGNHLDI